MCVCALAAGACSESAAPRVHPSDARANDAAWIDASLGPDGRPIDAVSRDASRLDARGDASRLDARGDASPWDATADAKPDAAQVDRDRDGLDDAYELALATAYLPFISLHPGDSCPTPALIVFRAGPHPDNPKHIQITYVILFQNDCGLNGHAGDDEGFGISLDPSRPAPEGILAIRAVAHQSTLCERKSECGRCPGMTPCDELPKSGVPTPALFSSRDKHGNNATPSACSSLTCFDACESAANPAIIPLVNVGEANAHLVEDLTAAGFITAMNGWTETELLNFNPWGPLDFGGAGNIAEDLVDSAFVPPTCVAP